MRAKALALRRIGGSSPWCNLPHPVAAGCEHASAHSHPFPPCNRNANIDAVFHASLLGQTFAVFHSNAQLCPLSSDFRKESHAFPHDAAADTDNDGECRDLEIQGASDVLNTFVQKELNISASDAATIVEGAPSFLQRLIELTKQKNTDYAGKLSPKEFAHEVDDYLKDQKVNLLEPLLESIGAMGKHLKSLVVQLSSKNVHSVASFINLLVTGGVPRSSLGALLINEPEAASCTEDEIEAGFKIFKGLKLPEPDLVGLILRYPLILKAVAFSNISVIRDELEEFETRDIIIRHAVCTYPQFFHSYKKGSAKEALDYLKGFNLTLAMLDQMLQKNARLILIDVNSKVKQNVKFLEDLGMDTNDIAKVLTRCPNFPFYSVQNNLNAKLEYFKVLGFNEAEFCQVINRFPKLFSVSMENKIRPVIEEVRTLGLSDDALKKVLLYRPRLFGYKLKGAMPAFIMEEVKKMNSSEASRVTAFIKLFSRSPEHRRNLVKCLVQHGLSAAEANMVLEREPGILGYNDYALSKKLDDLKVFDIPVHMLLTVPMYLSFELRKRVQRRERVLSYMKANDLLRSKVTLDDLVVHSNRRFYNTFVKPHFENKELCTIWSKEKGVECILTT